MPSCSRHILNLDKPASSHRSTHFHHSVLIFLKLHDFITKFGDRSGQKSRNYGFFCSIHHEILVFYEHSGAKVWFSGAGRQNRAICKFNLKIARFSRRALSRPPGGGEGNGRPRSSKICCAANWGKFEVHFGFSPLLRNRPLPRPKGAGAGARKTGGAFLRRPSLIIVTPT